jgi:uncharacterized protein
MGDGCSSGYRGTRRELEATVARLASVKRMTFGVGLAGRLALLAASMRAGGARVGVDKLVSAHRALAAVDGADRHAAYFALRPVLCSSHADLQTFDAAFAEWFGRGRGVDGEADALPAAWSPVELPRDKDFADYSDAERRAARAVMRGLAQRGTRRPSRRSRPAARRGPADPLPDLQRTLRAALRHDGEPLDRHWRAPAERPRPLVVVCDVSGSLEPYARMLLQYVQSCAAARRRVEAFVLGTDLTRVTAELRGRDPDRALDLACAATRGRSGGIRIGASLATLNREHGRRLGHGAVVVLLSDGCDRSDPLELEAELSRLSDRADRLIWLNPLKAHPDHEPMARGMRAALPYADHFRAGNSLQSLEQLVLLMEGGFE